MMTVMIINVKTWKIYETGKSSNYDNKIIMISTMTFMISAMMTTMLLVMITTVTILNLEDL